MLATRSFSDPDPRVAHSMTTPYADPQSSPRRNRFEQTHMSANAATILRIERLRKVLDVTRTMAATSDLDTLLKHVLDAACQVLDCARSSVFLFDADANELYIRAATGLREARFPANRGLAGAAAASRRVVNIPDAYNDDRFNRAIDAQTGFRTRSVLAIPLENLDGELMGVLQVLNKSEHAAFDEEDEGLAAVLGAQVGVALHRAHLLEQYAEKQRLAKELDIARTIQLAYLPRTNPNVDGYDVAGWNLSADATGGDCFDFIELEHGRLGIFLADATGHGVAAALVIAQCRSLLRALLTVTTDVQEVARRVNDLLERDIADGRFVTAFLGILDPHSHTLTYVSAGQAPLLHFTGGNALQFDATGLPLAVLSDQTFDCEVRQMAPQDRFVLLTDGFFEAPDQRGELFGDERVISVTAHNGNLSAVQLIDRLHASVQQWTCGAPQADDLTAIVVQRL